MLSIRFANHPNRFIFFSLTETITGYLLCLYISKYISFLISFIFFLGEFKSQVIINHEGSEEAQEVDEEDEDIFYDCEADESRFLNSFHSLTNMNSQAVYLEEKSSYHHGNKTFSNQQRIMTSHDMAVSIVETVFVLAEFWFWKVNWINYFSIEFYYFIFSHNFLFFRFISFIVMIWKIYLT